MSLYLVRWFYEELYCTGRNLRTHSSANNTDESRSAISEASPIRSPGLR